LRDVYRLRFEVLLGSERASLATNPRTKHLLGEARKTPQFANCVTPPAARGRHLYPSTLSYGLSWLGLDGYPRALINCDPENAAPVSGIRRAGFEPLAETRISVILGRIGLQRRRDRTGRA
jgi:hypothetical protein